MRGAPAKQGQVDGLCGIYCLLHVLRDKQLAVAEGTKFDRETAAFRFLLESASRHGLLTPYHIADGYYAQDLVAIFNDTCQRLEIPLRAEGFRAFKARNGSKTVADIVAGVTAAGGAAIVLIDSGMHWVLATSITGKMISILDSSKTDREQVAAGRTNSQQGLVILPVSSNA